ncbi:MAG TPA: PhzF family phenazine biosynthesis protein [Candidatus Limnocylindrales bacterium]|nr:PhzF family phenazine biosynthesis protein [Candidatus Limnocylindrales bacterium]
MSRRYRFRTVDVFTERPFAGNPLAVFPEADGLSDAEMQRIAQEMNLSETTFVLPPSEAGRSAGADYRMRIFTPAFEMPFAGHPSIGTAWVLLDEGRFPLTPPRTTVRQEVAIGVLALEIEVQEGGPGMEMSLGGPGMVTLTQGRPKLGPLLSTAEVAATAEALGVPEAALGWTLPDGFELPAAGAVAGGSAVAGESAGASANRASPRVVSTGVPYLVVPFRRREVQAAVPSTQGVDAAGLVARLGASALYLFAPGSSGAVADAAVNARLLDVSVEAGFIEDPATGSAAGPLAVHLARILGATEGTFRVVIEQGVAVGRPSRLIAEADHDAAGQPVAARVAGGVVPISEGVLTLPG